jgi:conjugative transposon TraK protein
MFKQFQSLDEGFRQVRWLSLGSIVMSAVVSIWTIYAGCSVAGKASQRIYLLTDGKAFEALAADRRQNLPVEARDQLRTFHSLLFNLDPDEKAIKASVGRALYLADGSAKALYDDQLEKGYISGLISGNISQSVELDSISVDFSATPYAFRCAGVETLTRSTNVTTRSLVTRGFLRCVERSDNNPHGFLIERFEVVENSNGKTKAK